jgi:Spy/CpxP family protein refolding chaperone
MRKTSLMLLLLATTVFMSFNLAAQPPQDKRGGGHRGPEADRAPIHSLVRAIHRNLELSEEQETAIRALTDNLKAEMKPLMKDMHEGMKAIHSIVTADSYDESTVAAIAAEQGELTRQKILATSNAAAGILAELTAEQRAELQALKDERQNRRHKGKRDRRQEGKPEQADNV